MKPLFSLFTICTLIFSSCKKEEIPIQTDERGAITSMPWLWRVSITESDYIGGLISYPVHFNSGVLIGAENSEGIDYLRFHDIENGEILWSQDYIYSSNLFHISDPYLRNNAIIIRDVNDIFSIDLITGEYLWRGRDEGWGYDWLSGIDSLFFVIDAVNDPETGYPILSASVGNTENGNLDLFLIPDLGEVSEPDMGRVNMAIGGFRYLKPFRNDTTGDIMLLCYYDKQYYLPNSNTQISKSYMGLFNFSQQKWICKLVELGERNFLEGFTPEIIGDRVYHTLSGGVAECRDLNTGEIVWRNEDNYQYSWVSFIIVKNKMIVLDDWYENLIAYELSTGNEVWRTISSATIDFMQELNGIVYFHCEGDGRLHAVEAETGKYIWHLECPDKLEDNYNPFIRQLTVVRGLNGQKGRVVISSLTHAYCYEAAR